MVVPPQTAVLPELHGENQLVLWGPAQLPIAMAEYIQHFCDCDRRHSSLGYLTPNEFEASHSTPTQPATLS